MYEMPSLTLTFAVNRKSYARTAGLPMKKNDIENILAEIAMDCFSSYEIRRDGVLFELSEIEIYLKRDSEGINDIFRHDVADHLKNDVEYIHYSGFDICMGNIDKNMADDKSTYCGVLVRGLISTEDNSYEVFGPGRVKYKYPGKVERKIEIIKRNKNLKDLSFYDGEPLNSINKNLILRMPRVNLSKKTCLDHLKTPDKLEKYLNLKARFLRVNNIKSLMSKNGPEELREVFNALIDRKI